MEKSKDRMINAFKTKLQTVDANVSDLDVPNSCKFIKGQVGDRGWYNTPLRLSSLGFEICQNSFLLFLRKFQAQIRI